MRKQTRSELCNNDDGHLRRPATGGSSVIGPNVGYGGTMVPLACMVAQLGFGLDGWCMGDAAGI